MILIQSDQSHVWGFHQVLWESERPQVSKWSGKFEQSECVNNVFNCRTQKEMRINSNENLYRTTGKKEGEGRGKASSA